MESCILIELENQDDSRYIIYWFRFNLVFFIKISIITKGKIECSFGLTHLCASQYHLQQGSCNGPCNHKPWCLVSTPVVILWPAKYLKDYIFLISLILLFLGIIIFSWKELQKNTLKGTHILLRLDEKWYILYGWKRGWLKSN